MTDPGESTPAAQSWRAYLLANAVYQDACSSAGVDSPDARQAWAHLMVAHRAAGCCPQIPPAVTRSVDVA